MSKDNWPRLSIGTCSYSQERIWLDESIRSSYTAQDEQLFTYNAVLAYRIDDGCLSVDRFRQSIEKVLQRNEIFATELHYDDNKGAIVQTIRPFTPDLYSLEITQIDCSDQHAIDEIVSAEQIRSSFDLNTGRIFRCHLLRQNAVDLRQNDHVLLVFHPSAVDHFSRFLFIKQLTSAYRDEPHPADEPPLRFIDYSAHERQLDLSASESFWRGLFVDYDFHDRLRLPYDHQLDRISSGSLHSFDIDASLTRQIFRYKSKLNTNFFRLFLSSFYCFLFKLTQDTDIAILGYTPNRYRPELTSILGPFENLLVYRHSLDPVQSFTSLLDQVDRLCTRIKAHSFYPFQNFVTHARTRGASQHPFSQVALRVNIDDEHWLLHPDDHLVLHSIALPEQHTKLTPVDLTLIVHCDVEKKSIRFTFDYANKLFEAKTIATLAKRFERLLKHLFDVSSTFNLTDEEIFKLSLILPDEQTLLHNVNST